MLVTLSGIVTLVRLLQLRNAEEEIINDKQDCFGETDINVPVSFLLRQIASL